MPARRLSLLLAVALLGSVVALAPSGASAEIGLSHAAAPPAPALDHAAGETPLQCTKQPPFAHEAELRKLGLDGNVRWCGGHARDDGAGRANNGAVMSGDGTAALDVDVTLPANGDGPFPAIVMLHGLGGSRESYWKEPAQYAARGFAVLDYTARGTHGTDEICLDRDAQSVSVEGAPEGIYAANGLACRTQLASRHYEVKDTQHLAGLLVDGALVSGVTAKPRIGVYGLSYGGGQTWMLTRDNTWRSPAGRRVRVAAAVPVIGWSDLLDALVPNGSASDTKFFKTKETSRTNERLTERVGVAKESYISTFYAGLAQVSGGSIPGYLSAWRDAVFAGEPYDDSPTVREAALRLITERSALFMPKDKGNPVILSIQGFTDVAFPASQSLNMYNLLNRNRAKPYPINMYFGDFGHPIAQNKAAETAHVDKLVRRWFDHYLKGEGKAPKRGVQARTTRCDDTGQPGALFKSKTWSGLQSGELPVGLTPSGTTLDTAVDDPRAGVVKPIDTQGGPYDVCRVTSEPPAEGNIAAASEALAGPVTMLGLPIVSFAADPSAADMYVSARLWDVNGSGEHTLVDRGVFRLQSDDPQQALFKLFGNAYTFEAGHTIELELTANDTRSFLAPNADGTIEISDLSLSLPVANPEALPQLRLEH